MWSATASSAAAAAAPDSSKESTAASWSAASGTAASAAASGASRSLPRRRGAQKLTQRCHRHGHCTHTAAAARIAAIGIAVGLCWRLDDPYSDHPRLLHRLRAV